MACNKWKGSNSNNVAQVTGCFLLECQDCVNNEGSSHPCIIFRSQRVYKDLAEALAREHVYEMHIAVREWADIKPEWEFRGEWAVIHLWSYITPINSIRTQLDIHDSPPPQHSFETER